MANKYYVISGNAEITQKNRNRFSIQKFLDDLYVIEENHHSAIWLKNKNAIEKTFTEANQIVTNTNNIITSQFNETYEIERQNHIAQYSPEDESNIVINTRIHNSEPLLQNLITEE